jgi:predicted enzyme related to lactoylglutathione lyase
MGAESINQLADFKICNLKEMRITAEPGTPRLNAAIFAMAEIAMESVSLKLLVLKTHDLAAACRFYRALGFTLTEEQHGRGAVHFSAPLGDGVLELYPLPPDQPADASTRIGFAISNLDATIAGITEAGGQIEKTPRETPWGYMAVVLDSDGRSVELYQN